MEKVELNTKKMLELRKNQDKKYLESESIRPL